MAVSAAWRRGRAHALEPATQDAEKLRGLARGQRIRFVGEASDVPAFLRELDVYCLIAEPEGCPNASLEAMMAGLPVIATDAGGANEQVIHEHNGLLVPRGDVDAFARAMRQLAESPELRARMSENSRKHVCEHFSEESFVQGYLHLLHATSN